MNKKVRKASRKSTKKVVSKARKQAGATNSQKPRVTKTMPIGPETGSRVEPILVTKGPIEPAGRIEIAIERIEGETIIGDLMVVFPRTRDVLKRHGLNLDVEEAGDIYMSLEAFAALRGLKAKTLVEELETASRELPPQPAPTIVTPVP